jgi:Ran GTPase-activating protein (RanGAP) involved in mRNA processing and transport
MAETNSITLTAGGDRNQHVTVAEAEAMVSRWTHEIAQAGDAADVHTLDISCRVWKAETLVPLTSFLQETVVPTIKVLKTDDIIASLPTNDGLATIQSLVDIFQHATNLEALSADDNALGSRATIIMGPLLTLPKLASLSFHNCGMSTAVGQELVANYLRNRTETPLTHFNMGRNAMGVDGAQEVATLIAASPHLEVFQYDGSRPDKEGTRVLMEAFTTMAADRTELPLRVLNLNDCTFGNGENPDEDSLDALIALVSKCPHLSVLDVTEGMTGPLGTPRLFTAVHGTGAQLTSLGLGGLGLREDEVEDGVEALCEFLASPSCANLHTLVLDTNELEDEGTAQIVQCLARLALPHLSELSLEGNMIGEDGMQALLDNNIETLTKINLFDNGEFSLEMAKDLVRLYGSNVLIRFDDDIQTGIDVVEEEDTAPDNDNGLEEITAGIGGL